MTTKQTTPLMLADEVAAILRLDPQTVYKLAKKGELPSISFNSRNVRFHPDDVQAYIDANRVPAEDREERELE